TTRSWRARQDPIQSAPVRASQRSSASLGVVAAGLAVLLLGGCRSKKEDPIDVPYVAPTQTAPPASGGEDVMTATTLSAAVDRARSKLPDGSRAPSDGGQLIAAWGQTHLAWDDVDLARPETSLALVERAPEAERGKRTCEQGEIVEIRSTTDGRL